MNATVEMRPATSFKPPRVFGLPNGRYVGRGSFVRDWRILKGLEPQAMVKGFDHFAMSAEEVLRRIVAGVHDRINRQMVGYEKGRKWDNDWQRHALQCALAVNTPRLIVRWIPQDLRGRLAHRLWVEEDG